MFNVREYHKEYQQTERGKYAHRKARNKYNQTLKGTLCNRFHRIKQRCVDPRHPRYKDYGGRGIKCKFETLDDFRNYVINVLQIDPRGLEVDRIDNNGHYEKGNIRFVTTKINANNRRNNGAMAR
ncbi:hypothetical protein LCGC14_0598020 [marine sediment metagenome]|uniref:Uncharacterized protein n=1 Tax=marine sediment metagenome TaxID=412755 RepID=A0A0F9UJU1_9ZZZZ